MRGVFYYYPFVVVLGADSIQTAVNIGCDCSMRHFACLLVMPKIEDIKLLFSCTTMANS
jgi:hypothetical protein